MYPILGLCLKGGFGLNKFTNHEELGGTRFVIGLNFGSYNTVVQFLFPVGSLFTESKESTLGSTMQGGAFVGRGCGCIYSFGKLCSNYTQR